MILLTLYNQSFLVITSCKEFRKISDQILQPTAREIYARDFDENDSVYQKWLKSYEEAKISNLKIKDPFSVHKEVDSSKNTAFGFLVDLKHGDRLFVEVGAKNKDSRFFINVFGDSLFDFLASAKLDERIWSKSIEKSGTYRIIIQPEIAFSGTFTSEIYTQPSYAFPVSGKNNSDIQSFWGADRDGGARRHEGIDIFAKRGTPLIAVTTGVISKAGDYGLGGKQVWLMDSKLGNSIYYAHLDSIKAKSGQRVSVGDTLGFVGNSGNAANTSPHLHFGIYSKSGAVDPYPFIKIRVRE